MASPNKTSGVPAGITLDASPQGVPNGVTLDSAPQGGTPTAQPGLIERFDKAFVEPQMAPPNEGIAHHIARGVGNFGGGAIGAVTAPFLHPVKTLAGIGGMMTAPVESLVHPGQDEFSQMGKGIGTGLHDHPEETLESLGGNVAGGVALARGTVEVAPPIGRAIDALPIPTRAKAGKLFEATMAKAGDLPVDTTQSSEPLMRAFDMGERGMQRPKVVNQLTRRLTTPDAEPMSYREARDFAQSLSRQSSSEGAKLTPTMKSQVGKLSHAFNEDVGRTAQDAGVGDEYQSAMNQYRQAMQIRKALINTGKIGGGALATGYLAHRLIPSMLPER